MKVSIVVPFRPDGAERDRNWAYVRKRYETLYPDWEIVEGTCGEPWRKGVAVNAAVKRARGDVLIISDADVLIPAQALRDAVKRLDKAAWVVPHRMVYRLSEETTQAVLDGRLVANPKPLRGGVIRTRRGASGGGITVTRREGYEAVGGIDERFEGWGGEDICFAMALDTLIGPHLRLNEVMWHLYHEAMPRRDGGPNHQHGGRASEESEALAAEYVKASGDPVAMQTLIEEQHKGMLGGGIVVAHREVIRSIPPDPLFMGWG